MNNPNSLLRIATKPPHSISLVTRMQRNSKLWLAAALPVYVILAFNVIFAASEAHMLLADRAPMEQVVGSEAACGMFVQYCSWRVYVAFDLIIFAIAAASIVSVFLWRGKARLLALSACAGLWLADRLAQA